MIFSIVFYLLVHSFDLGFNIECYQGGVLAVAQRLLSIVDEQLRSSFLEGKKVAESIPSTSPSYLSEGDSDLDEHPCEDHETSNKNIEGRFTILTQFEAIIPFTKVHEIPV